MIGHNRLSWLRGRPQRRDDGRTYAAWTKGAKPEDVELIKQAMAGRPTTYDGDDDSDRHHRRRYRHRPLSPRAATTLPLDVKKGVFRVVARAVGKSCARALDSCSCEGKKRNRGWLGRQDSNLRVADQSPAYVVTQQYTIGIAFAVVAAP